MKILCAILGLLVLNVPWIHPKSRISLTIHRLGAVLWKIGGVGDY